MQRVGPRRQSPGTFRRLANGIEFWRTFCAKCDSMQAVLDHRMVRHTTNGEPFVAETLAIKNASAILAENHAEWVQPELSLESTDDEEPPF